MTKSERRIKGAARKITADLQGIGKSAKSENAGCRKGYSGSERDIEVRKSVKGKQAERSEQVS
jgi:hypothetical protein